jgi:hypothetical protein
MDPAMVRPGKWARVEDMILGGESSDPRTFFVETTVFTAPAKVSLKGKRWERLSQLIAQVNE